MHFDRSRSFAAVDPRLNLEMFEAARVRMFYARQTLDEPTANIEVGAMEARLLAFPILVKSRRAALQHVAPAWIVLLAGHGVNQVVAVVFQQRLEEKSPSRDAGVNMALVVDENFLFEPLPDGGAQFRGRKIHEQRDGQVGREAIDVAMVGGIIE
jgi:hypothetical protein